MALIESGRTCVKKNGRDAGSKALVTAVIDGNFVKIMTSERNKERKCNIKHLEFLHEKIDIKDKNAIDRYLEIEKHN
jgi:ribosomal protein L14E/L6E/L27E